MSAGSIDQISLRSLDHSARSSRSRFNETGSLDIEDEIAGRSSSIAETSRDIDETAHVGPSGGYIDGGYGWVVTAGTNLARWF